MANEAHSDLIRDQFTRQATPFSIANPITDAGALDMIVAAAAPSPGDEAKVTEMFAASVADDSLGIPVRRDGDRLEYAYPVAILAARRT